MKNFFVKTSLFLLAFFAVLLFCFLQSEEQNKSVHKSGQPLRPYRFHKIDQFSVKYKENFDTNKFQRKSPLARTIKQEIKDSNFSGSILIIHKNKILLNTAYGYADKNTKILNTPKSFYGMASIEKGLTALLIMKQIQAGKITLQTKLDLFYPKIPNAKKITIHNLLTMTSGLSSKGNPINLKDGNAYIDWYTDHAIQKYPIGSWHYDATNFKILAGILKILTKKSYATNLKTEFGNKFHFLSPGEFVASKNHTYSYKNNLTTEASFSKDPSYLQREVATGNLFTTTGNLYLYFRQVLNGKLIPKKLVEEMYSKVNGFAYASGAYNYPRYYKAHGYILSYEPSIFINKNATNAVIVLSNVSNKVPWEKLAEKIFQKINI
ncbi:putative Putative penicillin-binding protein PbpX [Oenococcus oeni]|uniref:serine hydrolase domain-containing protein n=1 Tax=Oenococcus oeni TaxID=1247 RepID=UPI0010771814|nr:serine hydrolase domain-containing protein [Oenococcus oeni]AVI94771.1 serine hydrolase [Oenococcus oeni]SYV98777.1 putative Putative penicillin-binding protein PbpX [Oenococcus oeni]SYW03818.1 putative Putative penicillin-binding protein PbpX [Oenococcus oeni]SYW18019.1 putative Putative penicillin-binding protein PbpX [Oenococcus oeni]VDC15385.1 putative Putative penicillin-binding protein PbpX [Oenococcus oeni]